MSPAEVMAALSAPPPRDPEVAARIARALEQHGRFAPIAGGLASVAAVANLTGHPTISAVGFGGVLVGLGVERYRRRRWLRRLAREGALLPCEITEGTFAHERGVALIASFELAGIHTTARAPGKDVIANFVGPAWVLSLPEERPARVHVFGRYGSMQFKLDPIEVPGAKLLRK